jgi:hypothetical protein
MYGDISVGKFALKIWFGLFFLLQLVLLAFIIGSLAAPSWVYSNFSTSIAPQDTYNGKSNTFDGSSFRGSLFMCKNGCSNNYRSESSDWCDDYNHNTFTDSTSKNQADSVCKLFTRLSGSGGIYIVASFVSLIGILSWFCTMLCLSRKTNCFCLTFCCSGCSCVAYYVGFLAWFGISQASFSSCSDFPSDGSAPIVCADAGPGLGVFLMIVFPAISIGYLVISCLAYKKRALAGQPGLSNANSANLAPPRYPPGFMNQKGPAEETNNLHQPPTYVPQHGANGPPTYVPQHGGNEPPKYVPGQSNPYPYFEPKSEENKN